jgi:hypothetical protein
LDEGDRKMMRRGFGGHPFGPHEAEQRERREGGVGDIYREESTAKQRCAP